MADKRKMDAASNKNNGAAATTKQLQQTVATPSSSAVKTTTTTSLKVDVAADLPPIRLALRTPQATLLATLSKDGKSLVIDEKREKAKKVFCILGKPEAGEAEESNPKVTVSLLNPEGVLVSETGPETEIGAVHAMELSPHGSYVVSWIKPQDLILRRNSGGKEILLKLIHKKPPSGDAFIQYNQAETYACYQIGGEVKVWDTRKVVAPSSTAEGDEKNSIVNLALACRIRVEGLTSYSICPETPADNAPWVATFSVGKSGMPSSASLFEGETKLAFANTFRADYCTYKWSPFSAGDALAKLETSVDATGQSYYGESKLVLLSATRRQAVEVVCGKEGAVHDFAWSPRRHVFVVVAGKSPARCTLYDGKTADPIFEFGESHKNIACFSPSGRFMCLAGFGNLAGQMDFWDVKRNRLLGSGKADAAVGYGWSPCGRLFMTATLAPRMNVDNGVTIYSYRGEKLSLFKANEPGAVLGNDGLLECRFLPVSSNAFPDLPPTPKEGDGSDGAAAKGGAKAASSAAAPPKKDVYRPPGASAGVVGAKSMSIFSVSAKAPVKSTDSPKIVKSAAKPEPAKANVSTAKKAISEPKSEAPPATRQESDDGDENEKDPEKLLRKFKKLLRQIEEIEQKGGPKDDNQKAKVLRRKELEDKVKQLEDQLKPSSL